MLLVHRVSKEEIEDKLKKCFHSLNLLTNGTVFHRAKEDTINVINVLQSVLPLPSRQSNSFSFCWNINIYLKLNPYGILTGHINNHRIRINLKTDPSFADPRHYYINMLKTRTHINRGLRKKRLCIPRVFLAGFPKSGSTALDHLLLYNTNMKHGISKEPRWWVPPLFHPNARSFQPTVEYFVKYVLQYFRFAGGDVEETMLLLDSSPNIFGGWSNLRGKEGKKRDKERGGGRVAKTYEGVCLLPTVFSALLPRPQFIIILRDPIEYLYSNFWFRCSSKVYCNYNLTRSQALQGPSVFHELVKRRLNKFKSCNHSVDQCILDQSLLVDDHDKEFPCGRVPLGMSVYYVHVKKWLSLFERSSFFFITSEEFFEHPFNTVERIWDFLGVSRPQELNYTLMNERISQSLNSQDHFDYRRDIELQMLTRTRINLKVFFKPFNDELIRLLQHNNNQPWRHSWQERINK